MSFSNAQAFAGLRATATPDAPQTRNNNEVGFAPFTANLTDAESVYSVRATLANADVLTLDPLTGDTSASVLSEVPATITISGITVPTLPSGGRVLPRVADVNGKPSWAADGWSVYWDDPIWYVASSGEGYEATKSSTANTPIGLTTWTINSGTGQPTITGSAITSEIVGGDGNDIYGDPLPTIDTIQGVMIKCISGAADIEVNGNELKSVTEGDVRLAFNPAGMPSYADDLEATATAANTVLEIVVIGKNA